MRGAIALLITLLFVMLITLSIGIGLKYLNETSANIENEKFLVQTNVILDDIMLLLKTSKDLESIGSKDDLAIVLSEASFIPFEASGIKIIIELQSARSKLNPNNLRAHPDRAESMKEYLSHYMINIEYVDMLVDVISGIKEDLSYNTQIFNEKPYLFRNYVASAKQLGEVDDFYKKTTFDVSLRNIDFNNLFYYAKDNNNSYKVDLNYATVEAWEMMLGVDRSRAEELNANAGDYNKLGDINLMDDEKVSLMKFNTSYYEPYVYVTLSIMQNDNSATIKFEYDIRNKKGSNFVYEI